MELSSRPTSRLPDPDRQGRTGDDDGQPPGSQELAKDLIEGAGAKVMFLPPYSPDFVPIEETYSKAKGIPRRIGAGTREVLVEATGQALDAVDRRDAVGWFMQCSYDVAHQLLRQPL